MLDDILRALLLKQKEAKAMMALEEIFDIVLRYAASLRRDGDDDNMASTTRRLQDDFRKQVRHFLDQIMTASSRDPRGHELDPFEHLLLMLDFNGFWTKG